LRKRKKMRLWTVSKLYSLAGFQVKYRIDDQPRYIEEPTRVSKKMKASAAKEMTVQNDREELRKQIRSQVKNMGVLLT
jgi:hypothetical protein